jgi:hypothetical protein
MNHFGKYGMITFDPGKTTENSEIREESTPTAKLLFHVPNMAIVPLRGRKLGGTQRLVCSEGRRGGRCKVKIKNAQGRIAGEN